MFARLLKMKFHYDSIDGFLLNFVGIYFRTSNLKCKKNQAWIPKKNCTADGAKFASLAQKCPRTFFSILIY